MLKSRKLFHALALVGAFTIGSVASFAQCTGTMSTTNLGVRPEGLAEPAGSINVTCGPNLPPNFTVLVQLTSGVNVSNNNDLDPVFTGSATAFDFTYPAGIPNAINLQVTGATGSSFSISGIRINANGAASAGISNVQATLVVTAVDTGTILQLQNNPSLVATILAKSLNFTVSSGNNATESDALISSAICVGNANLSGFLRFSENFANVLRTQQQELNLAAGATTGTQLRLVFANIPAGVQILLPTSTFTTGNTGLSAASGIGSAVTLPSGADTTYTPAGTDTMYNGGYGPAGAEVLYNVVAASTASVDTLNIPYIIRYTGGPSVGVGTGTAKGTLAPVSSDGIPRFADVGDTANVVTTTICSTTLLYPYVTTAAGYDTGIAISNTSADPAPFSTPNQSGTCSLNLFGAYDSGATVPGAGTTPTINAGRVYAISLNDSPAFASGARVGPGFTGYLIAICNFQLAHGFAFVSDYGARNLAMGYLPLIIKQTDGSRSSGAAIEQLDN